MIIWKCWFWNVPPSPVTVFITDAAAELQFPLSQPCNRDAPTRPVNMRKAVWS